MNPESNLVNEFVNRFNLQKLDFFIEAHTYQIKATIPKKYDVQYDAAITINNKIVCIIEFKSERHFNLFRPDPIQTYARQNNIRYWALSDGQRFQVTDTLGETYQRDYNFNTFIELITTLLKGQEKPEYIKNRIANILIEEINKFKDIKSNFRFSEGDIEKINNQLDYDFISNSFSFKKSSDINSIEFKLFKLLLRDDKKIKRVFRYSTLPAIYAILKNNSYRMNCIVGMNDTTEVNYAENYIYGNNVGFANAPWQTIDSYNRRFISSCTLLEDDLTMYRLYSDDSQGVCLTFRVKELKDSRDFILKKVSYAQENGLHPELEILKNIVTAIRNNLRVNFIFRGFSIWKHFFKPYDYHTEEEVRLLYILRRKSTTNKGWQLTTSHQILNPFVDFQLNKLPLPLELTDIKFGPKCPEKDINIRQFEQFLRDHPYRGSTLSNVTCSLSNIVSYR